MCHAHISYPNFIQFMHDAIIYCFSRGCTHIMVYHLVLHCLFLLFYFSDFCLQVAHATAFHFQYHDFFDTIQSFHIQLWSFCTIQSLSYSLVPICTIHLMHWQFMLFFFLQSYHSIHVKHIQCSVRLLYCNFAFLAHCQYHCIIGE